MSITAKELAKKLNLSEAAISMALNNKPGVSTQTRKKVIAAAKEAGYDFSKLSSSQNSSVSNGSIFFILYCKHGAIVSDTPFFSELSKGISQTCEQFNFYVNMQYLYDTNDIDLKLSEFISSGCKGLILLGTEMQKEDLKPFLKSKLPLVVLDCYFDEITTNYVMINNIQGAYLATNHLIQQKKCQPGYLRSAYPIQNFNERADGFFKALRANGMSTSRSIVHKLTPSVEGAYADMLSIIKSGEDLVTCYFADNDLIAAGAIKAFKEMGYHIPKDISIIGFDDLPLCTYMDPPLSTIQVPKQYMGKVAAKRIIELISNPNSFPTKIEIETALKKRGSV